MMSVFQVGDIVECLVDHPYGARIHKGGLAIIVGINYGVGGIRFKNYPQHSIGGAWSGQSMDFILYNQSLENE